MELEGLTVVRYDDVNIPTVVTIGRSGIAPSSVSCFLRPDNFNLLRFGWKGAMPFIESLHD